MEKQIEIKEEKTEKEADRTLKFYLDLGLKTYFFKESSAVVSAVHLQDWLIVLFKSGHAYAYSSENAEDLLKEMIAAESPGKFVHAKLKTLQSTKLDDIEAKVLTQVFIQRRILDNNDETLLREFITSNRQIVELYNSKYFKPSL